MRPRRPSSRRDPHVSIVEGMEHAGEVCAGRGDGTDCPNGEDAVMDGPRCEECQYHWELDHTEPGRRAAPDDGMTRPTGEPGEVGKENAA